MAAIFSSVLVSFIAFAGLLTLSLKKDWINRISFLLVALAAGTFLGGAFFHLLPESIELAEETGTVQSDLLIFTLIGILLFFILEEIIHWHHHIDDIDDEEKRHKHHLKPIAITNLIGDGFHNFLDGLAIAASFAESNEMGTATLIAIILHEIPQEIADFGILIYSGLSRTKALLWNFASGLLSVLGVVFFFIFENTFEDIEKYLLAFIAGVFIYIASTDLFPEIHKNKKIDLLQIAALLIGVGLMYGMTVLE